MCFRRIIVCLIVLALALPWPGLGHAMATTAAGAGNEAAPMMPSTARADDASTDKTGHGKGNGGCHGRSSPAAGNPATDSALAGTGATAGANATAAVDNDSNHDCCSDACDCGCLTTAWSATLAVLTHHATPRLVGGFIATTAASVTSPRLLRPPITG